MRKINIDSLTTMLENSRKELIEIIGDETIGVFDNYRFEGCDEYNDPSNDFNPLDELETKTVSDILNKNHWLDDLLESVEMIFNNEEIEYDKDLILEFMLSNDEDITEHVKNFFEEEHRNQEYKRDMYDAYDSDF